MKLPRSGFTVQRLMFVVAIAAIALGLVEWMGRRSAAFRLKAREHEETFKTLIGPNTTFPLSPATAHHRIMAEKYRLAARSPWLHVATDPPEPED
jgi:predicted xylose isomerase-like sugar epimerase